MLTALRRPASPAWSLGVLLAPPPRPPGHAGQLHRLRLRPVHRAEPAGDGRLADQLAVLGGRHLHLRRLARLPEPAEPDPDLGQHPARPRLAAAADHPRPAGLVHDPRALPAPGPDQPAARRTATRAARAPGPRRGDKTIARRAPRSASSPGSTLWYDIESFDTASTDCRESALSFLSPGPTSCTSSATSPASTPAPRPASRCSTTPGPRRPGRYRMPDQIWIARLERPRRHRPRPTCAATGWTPHRRVHQYRGAAQRDLRRRDHRHRPRTGSTSATAPGAPPSPAHCGGAAGTTTAATPRGPSADRGALVRTVQCLLRGRGTATPAPSTACTTPGSVPRCARYRVGRGLSSGTPTTGRRPGWRCCPRATRPGSSAAPPRPPSAGCSGR